MNSLRIGVIGVLVEYQGIAAAQGFLHFFEGWVVFLLCLLVLLGVTAFLHRVTRQTESLRDALAFRIPTLRSCSLSLQVSKLAPIASATGLLALAIVASLFVTDRVEIIPDRAKLSSFPLTLSEWHGVETGLDEEILQALALTDYFSGTYSSNTSSRTLNFYVAYYASQRRVSCPNRVVQFEC
jgi:hypothetical protein